MKYNLIIMATPYDKILKRIQPEPKKKPLPISRTNPYLHRISFDDSDDSSRFQIPNIFLDDRDESIPSPPRPKKQEPPPLPTLKTQTSHKLMLEKVIQSPPRKKSEPYSQAFPEVEQQIAEPEPQLMPNSSLSLFQIAKLHLGEYLFRNTYPIKNTIFINNNNEYENELNLKDHHLKTNNQKQIIHYSNSLKSGMLIFLLALVFRNLLEHLYVYLWIAIIVLQYIAEQYILKMPIQYGTDKVAMIVLLVLAVTIQIAADWFTFRKRNHWEDNQTLHRIYHHNGEVAEWVNTKASDIKAGNIYKLASGQPFPTDSVLLYSEHSLVQINQSKIVCQLTQHPSEIVLKETLLKGDVVPLPLSGYINYEISIPEYTDFQVIGKLHLEEPSKLVQGVQMSNIVLRGSINSSNVQIFCLSLDTGIDSLFLKSLQYPFQQRKYFEYSTPMKSKNVSSEVTEQVKQHQGTLQGCNLQKKVQSTISILFMLYLSITGLGILARFGFGLTTGNEFFLSKATISIWKILLYHATNYIIMIPVLLVPMYKTFVAISGHIAEKNISKRTIQVTADPDKHKRTNSLIESASSIKNQELLDNQKIIFPLKIKDYNLLPQLNKVDTIITTIDTFRDNSAYTLHSIRVKQVSHNFMTNSLQNEAISTEDIKTMKYFMEVAMLTTTKNQYDNDLDQPTNYDEGIQFAAKKYFNLKKKKNSMGEITVGDFFVKQLFHIKPVYQYPYKVVFLQPVIQADDESKRVLVLIRGNTKTILNKCYGKAVKYTQQSRDLQDKKGYHVQLVAKLSLHSIDAQQIQKAYTSSTLDKKLFYKNLDRYISKVQSMGLLVFVNQFHQKKIGQSLKNPILNKSIINFSSIPKTPSVSTIDYISSQMMPNMIILMPLSKAQEPAFEQIHTSTNLLINPYLFHLGLAEVGSKIYQDKPNDLDRMFNQLQQQKILVWSGWDQRDIIYTIDVMKKYGRNILFYSEKDQYMYLNKQADFSIKGSGNGYDGDKYSDINFTSRSSISYLYILQLLKYDSVVVRQGFISILITQIGKYVFYLIIQTINIFFTRGTALMIIKTPLYLVIQITLFLDIFYYLNWKDTVRASTFSKRETYSKTVGTAILQKLVQGIFVTLICCYSVQTPSSSSGTPHPYQYTYFTIAFTIVHILVFQKLFNILTQTFSIYKGVVIITQIIVIYMGFLIVSLVDTKFYYGILWSALAEGNIFITAIGCIWICLTLPAIRLLLTMLKGRNLKARAIKKDF